ncbi:MAG: ATP-binding cassette domain-containing protein, partial [Pseudomonadota bacterium]
MTQSAPRRESAATIGTAGWLASMSRQAPAHALGVLAFSLAVNLLMLVSPLFMLQIYDRVLASGSVDTLIWLSMIAVFLLTVYAAAEAGRRRVLALAGSRLERRFAPRIFKRFESGIDDSVALPRDAANLSRTQTLLQNGSLLAFFDLPFTPFFIGLLFLVNPALGLLGVVGAVAVFVVAILAEISTRRVGERAALVAEEAQTFASGVARQRSAVVAMGLSERLEARWRATRLKGHEEALNAARGDGAFAAVARALRQILQILVLAAGAALALSQQISPGGIVAGSIILSRALAPVDQIVSTWRGLVAGRSAWAALKSRLGPEFDRAPFTPLPAPAPEVSLDRLSVSVPGTDTPLIRPFSYVAEAPVTVAIVGGNGTGKTTLLQTLAGVWPPASGVMRLGGRDVHAWPASDRGPHVGYVPQDVELSPGTVAENIARFET